MFVVLRVKKYYYQQPIRIMEITERIIITEIHNNNNNNNYEYGKQLYFIYY